MDKLTDRQRSVLECLAAVKVCGSGADGSVLRALARKGLVVQHHNAAPSGTYYTWTLAQRAKTRNTL